MKKKFFLLVLIIFTSFAYIPLTASAAETFNCVYNWGDIINHFFSTPYRCDIKGFPITTETDGRRILENPANCPQSGDFGTTLICQGAPAGYDCQEPSSTGRITCQSRTTPPTPQPAPEGSASTQITYIPLEPIPGLLDQGGKGDFASFITALFRILIVVGALVAVGTLVTGGVMYMTTEASKSKGAAKDRIEAALYGLLILIGAVLLLNTVNPTILNFGGATGAASAPPQLRFTDTTPLTEIPDGTDYGPATTPAYQADAASSAAGREIVASAHYNEQGYVGLIAAANGVSIISQNPDAPAGTDFTHIVGNFRAGCEAQGGHLETYQGSDRRFYYCGDVAAERTLSTAAISQVQNTLPNCNGCTVSPTYLVFSRTYVTEVEAERAAFRQQCTDAHTTTALVTGVTSIMSGSQLVNVCYSSQ